jgi:hypothetical protein
MFFVAESLMERTSRMRVLFSHTLCIDLSKHLPLCRLCPHDVMGSGQFEFQLVMCVFTHLALQRVGKKKVIVQSNLHKSVCLVPCGFCQQTCSH